MMRFYVNLISCILLWLLVMSSLRCLEDYPTDTPQIAALSKPQSNLGWLVKGDTLIAKRFGKKIKRHFSTGWYVVDCTDSVAMLIARSSERVEKNLPVQALSAVIPTGVSRIGATNYTGSNDVDIGIIDTGVDSLHQDLNVVNRTDFSGENNVEDGYGHGTHVAGIVAAKGIGVVGVIPGARLWSIKVLNSNGVGSDETVAAGLDYAASHSSQIEVVNLSLGGTGFSYAMWDGVRACVKSGIVVVVAAGNSRADIYGADGEFGTPDDFVPAAYPEVITVSSLTDYDGKPGGLVGGSILQGQDDAISTFSNYSKSATSLKAVQSPGAGICVAAPGVGIYSTYPGNRYATFSGTSMASPHVAGMVARICAAKGRAFDEAGVMAIAQGIVNSAESQRTWRTDGAISDPDQNLEGLVTTSTSETPIPGLTTIKITSPLAGAVYKAGELIAFQATATLDSQDVSQDLTWETADGIKIGSGSPFILQGLTPNKEYLVFAKYQGFDYVSFSIWDTLTITPPSNVDVNYTNTLLPLVLSISWTDNSNNEQMFEVGVLEGKGRSATWRVFGQTTSTTIYVTANYGQTYIFGIRAINPFNKSSWTQAKRFRT